MMNRLVLVQGLGMTLVFPSVKDAGRFLQVPDYTIRSALDSGRPVKGFTFDEPLDDEVVKEEVERPMIALAFDLYDKGRTPRAVARELAIGMDTAQEWFGKWAKTR